MKKTLDGIHVLVTRPKHQAQNLTQLLQNQAAEAVLFPTLDIVATDNKQAIQSTLKNLEKFKWLIFISANAVNFAVQANGGKIPALSQTQCAAVGLATAKSLTELGYSVDLVPEHGFNSDALLAMPQMQDVAGQQILIVRGVGGRDLLATALTARGARVDYLEVYKRSVPQLDCTPVLNRLKQGKLDIITATSVEALQNLLGLLGTENHKLLFHVPLIVVSDRIKEVALGMGFNRVVVTENPSDTAILDTVTTCVMGS